MICSSLQTLPVLWLTKVRSLPTLARCELNSILVEGLYANVPTATGPVLSCLASRHWLTTWQQEEYKKIPSVPPLLRLHLLMDGIRLDEIRLMEWSGLGAQRFWFVSPGLLCLPFWFIMPEEELHHSCMALSWILMQGLGQLHLKGKLNTLGNYLLSKRISISISCLCINGVSLNVE